MYLFPFFLFVFFLFVWQQNSNKSVVMISIFLLLGLEDLENIEIQSIRGNRLNFIVWTWQREMNMKMWIFRVFMYEIKTNFCKVFFDGINWWHWCLKRDMKNGWTPPAPAPTCLYFLATKKLNTTTTFYRHQNATTIHNKCPSNNNIFFTSLMLRLRRCNMTWENKNSRLKR